MYVDSVMSLLWFSMSQSSNALKMELPYPLALQIVKHANKIVAIRGDLNVLVQLTLVHFFCIPQLHVHQKQ